MSGLVERLLERRSTLAVPDKWFADLLTDGAKSAAGISVNETNAFGYIPYVAAVKIIAESIATLPLPLYRRLTGGGKERATAHPLYRVLHDAPNPEMTAFEFRELLTSHVCAWGNGYAEKVTDGSGQVRELWPLRPDRMYVIRKDGELRYEYLLPDNTRVVVPGWRLLHVRGLSFDGMVGYSVIRTFAREAIGLGKAAETFGSGFFANDARPGVYIVAPPGWSPEARDNFHSKWKVGHDGLGKAHRSAILESGMDIKTVGIPPEDAQFLETRRFQVQEIARLFRIPPHMLADVEGSTSWGSGIEQQQIGFVSHALASWMKRWEQAIWRDLIAEPDKPSHFAEFLVEGFLRGDTAARWQGYTAALDRGIYCIDEVREMENRNPLPDGMGKKHLVQAQMTPIDKVGEPITAGGNDDEPPDEDGAEQEPEA